MIRVALVEDNDTIRLGLAALIDGTPGYECAGAWASCEEMLTELREIRPGVLLMDIGLPGMSGIEGVRRARAVLPDLNILILTVYDENDLVFEVISQEMIERIAEVEGGLQEETTYDGRKLRWSEEARKGLWTMKNAYQRRRVKARVEKRARMMGSTRSRSNSPDR